MNIENKFERVDPGSNEALKQYAEALRMRIDLKIGELFPNKNCDYTAVIVAEFLRAAKKYIHIFCGTLNGKVYGSQLDAFKLAFARGVEIRVLTSTSHDKLDSRELADYLKSKCAIRSETSFAEIPHFIDVDGNMFRLEKDMNDRTAVVCAYASQYQENKEVMERIVDAFNSMWAVAENHE